MFRVLSVVSAIVILRLLLGITPVMGQSKQDGIDLYREGDSLREKAQSVTDLKMAVEKYEQALRIFEAVKFDEGIAVVANNVGVIYSDWGKHDKAVHYYEKSLAIKRKLKDPGGEGRTLNNLGLVYSDWGQYDKAVEYYEKSLILSRDLRDSRGEGRTLNNLGMVYSAWGQYDKAAEYYEKSLAMFRELRDLKREGSILNNLGLVYSNWGQYDKAVKCYEKSLAIKRELKDSRGEAQTLNNFGMVCSNLGQYDKALEYYGKSLAIYREFTDTRGEGATLNNLATVFSDWGQYDKALEYYEKALAIFQELKDPKAEEQTLNSLGNVYNRWGQYDKALEYYEKALTLSRDLRDRSGEGSTLNNLGSVHKERGQYDKAVEYYEKALTLSRDLRDPRSEEATLNNLGLVYMDRGQYDKAVVCYEAALTLSRKIKHAKGEGLILHNLANVFSDWGQYDKASEYYDKSLTICQELKDRSGEASTLVCLGQVFGSWGQYDKAVEYYQRGLKIIVELKERRTEGLTLNNLGKIYAAQREYSKALTNFHRALEIYKVMGVPTGLAVNNVGNLYLDTGEVQKAELIIEEEGHVASRGRLSLVKADYTLAKKYYQGLLKSAEKNRNVNDLFTAYTALGTAFEATGDDKKAEEYFREAFNLAEELRSTVPKAQRETFFDVRINGFLRTAPYDGLARIRLRMNKPLEAFKDSEYTKSRVFAEAMSRWSEGTRFDIPSQVLRQDQELTDQIAALKKKRQVAYEKANQEVISVIEPQVQELEKKLQAHINMTREKYPLFAATKYPEPMDLSQTALKEDEWVLEYHVTDPGTIIYLIQGKKIVKVLFKPIRGDELEKLVQKFRQPLEITSGRDNFSEKLASFDLKAGKELSDILLSDILEWLPSHTPLLIVPDDSLGVIPFEMLVLGDAGSIKTDKDLPYVSGVKFFGDRNLISYSQSVTALTLSRTHAKSRATRPGMLAIADPVFEETDERVAAAPKTAVPTGSLETLYKWLGLKAAEKDGLMGGLKFDRLPRTRQLARDLESLYKGPSKICTGFDATKDHFLRNISSTLNQYDKIVFATHGYFGKDLPGIMEPVLVLTLIPPGTHGYLRMTEVMGLRMNADIVALTACQTGLGKRISGEGTMGMGRAFQYAGARSVLMSLWSVSEVTSVRLVKSFFQHMKHGKSKLEALSLARQEIRKKGFDHPFFWAGFILVGEGN